MQRRRRNPSRRARPPFGEQTPARRAPESRGIQRRRRSRTIMVPVRRATLTEVMDRNDALRARRDLETARRSLQRMYPGVVAPDAERFRLRRAARRPAVDWLQQEINELYEVYGNINLLDQQPEDVARLLAQPDNINTIQDRLQGVIENPNAQIQYSDGMRILFEFIDSLPGPQQLKEMLKDTAELIVNNVCATLGVMTRIVTWPLTAVPRFVETRILGREFQERQSPTWSCTAQVITWISIVMSMYFLWTVYTRLFPSADQQAAVIARNLVIETVNRIDTEAFSRFSNVFSILYTNPGSMINPRSFVTELVGEENIPMLSETAVNLYNSLNNNTPIERQSAMATISRYLGITNWNNRTVIRVLNALINLSDAAMEMRQ